MNTVEVVARCAPRNDAEAALAASDFLCQVRAACVYDVAQESALQAAPQLSARLARPVWLKREDQQPVFSFKLRGAYHCMSRLERSARDRGVITASAGNHAQGVALAAAKLGVKTKFVVREEAVAHES